jgi:hypothetical protein
MINPSNNVKDSFVAVTIEAVRLKKSVKIKSENELSQQLRGETGRQYLIFFITGYQLMVQMENQ